LHLNQAQLILNGSKFSHGKRQLILQCTLFENHPNLLDSPYSVRSRVSASSFESFLSSVDGTPIAITASNYTDLMTLSAELSYSGLRESLSAFDPSQAHCHPESLKLLSRITLLEEERISQNRANAVLQDRVRHLESELTSLRSLSARCDELERWRVAFEKKHPSGLHDQEELPPPFDPLEFLRSLQKQPSDYETVRTIGKGVYIEWLLTRELSSGKEFGLGAMNGLMKDSTYRILFVRGVIVPLVLNLPRVTPIFGFFTDKNKVAMITEFYANGTLESALKSLRAKRPPVGFGPTEISKSIFGIAFVMAQFHARQGIHRNLSLASIFMDSRFEPVISSCIFAKIVRDPLRLSLGCGTPLFMAPELLEEKPYDCSVDVFAFGVLVCAVFEPTMMEGIHRGLTM
jgi:hypothetical protein